MGRYKDLNSVVCDKNYEILTGLKTKRANCR